MYKLFWSRLLKTFYTGVVSLPWPLLITSNPTHGTFNCLAGTKWLLCSYLLLHHCAAKVWFPEPDVATGGIIVDVIWNVWWETFFTPFFFIIYWMNSSIYEPILMSNSKDLIEPCKFKDLSLHIPDIHPAGNQCVSFTRIFTQWYLPSD